MGSYTFQGQAEKKFSEKDYCMMVLQRKYCRDVNEGIYKNIYQCLVVLDPYKKVFISKVCLEVTDPIKMYVIIKAVSIHLKINIIMKSNNVWPKLLVGNEGLVMFNQSNSIANLKMNERKGMCLLSILILKKYIYILHT